MSWVKLTDDFADNRKIIALTDSAFRLYMAGLCYAAYNLTDGAIPREIIRRLGWHCTDLAADLAQLTTIAPGEEHPLWERTDTGWTIHDYLDYNPPRSAALALKASRAAAGAAGGRAGTGASKDRSKPASKPASETQAERNPVPVPLSPTEDRIQDPPPDPAAATTTPAGVWQRITGLAPGIAAIDAMRRVEDLDVWAEVVNAWLLAGYNPANIAGQIDWYEAGGPPRSANSRRPPTRADYATSATQASAPREPAPAVPPERWLLTQQHLRNVGLAGFLQGAQPIACTETTITIQATPHILGMLQDKAESVRNRAKTAIKHAESAGILIALPG